jgi:predicted nucleic acid-binding protein
MNIIDSSAWIEFFVGGKNASHFKEIIAKRDKLIIPAITLYEVSKKFLTELGEEAAMECIAFMTTAKVIDLDIEISINAAKISKENKLAMADSIIMATAQKYEANIWTQDADFKGLPNVKYFPKPS